MSKKTGSFQENIRGTFIRFSLVPVAVIVTAALFLFVFSWIMFMAHFNMQENEAIASEITRTMNICNEMISDVADSLVSNNYEVKDSEIFSVLYKRTADFGEMGNLIILSSSHKTLFSSKNSVPRFLTGSEYYDWGVWHQIYKNKNSVNSLLYNKNLYITYGLYEGSSLKAAIVYAIPGEAITSNISAQARYVIITDNNGWVYASNTKKLQDEYGKAVQVFTEKTGYIRYEGNIFYANRNDTGKGLVVYTINDISRSVNLIYILIVIIVVIFLAIALVTMRSTKVSSEKYTKENRMVISRQSWTSTAAHSSR